MCKRPLIKFRSLKRSRTGVWANWALSVQCTRRAGRSRWRLMDAQSFLRKTDRCVTHATFVQWDRGKDGPSESRDSPRALALLPPSVRSDSDVGNFYDISLSHDGDGLEEAAGLPGGPARAEPVRSYDFVRRRRAEGKSRKGKERLESCNAQTATKMCDIVGCK